ncbi:hypothetical protein Hanom_Chr07g00607171 [Helianthus anomalus]
MHELQLRAKHVERDFDTEAEDCYIAMEALSEISGPFVLICGQNKVSIGSKEKEKFTMILSNLGRLAKLPQSLQRLAEGIKPMRRPGDNDI